MKQSENWRKLGLIFRPDKGVKWMQSHASLPVPVHMGDSQYRIFFSSRDGRNRSHVGWFDIDLDEPCKVVQVSDRPILEPGPLGHFDDHGVYAASAVRDGSSLYLYTIGWNPGMTPPLFYTSIGLAVSKDGGETFERVSTAPIMARSEYDPCLVTAPMVLKEGNLWRMWYISGYRWDTSGPAPHSHYHIKYAESADGVHWVRGGRVCLDHVHAGETNIARPCVIRGEAGYRAWYSYSCGQGYEIGYAESLDGLEWMRRDAEAGIERSNNGWDSEAIAYPFVVVSAAREYMFYNGNGFGRDGIGIAMRARQPGW